MEAKKNSSQNDPLAETEEGQIQDNQTNQSSDPKKEPEEETNNFKEKWQRAVADLENYRKQVERDRIEFSKFASEQCLTALLPVLENFKRAADHLPEDLTENDWAKGIKSIEKQLEQTLAELGLKKIEAKIGEACDPNKHEMIATGEGEKGAIIEVLEDGFELNGKVLRAAKVKVGA